MYACTYHLCMHVHIYIPDLYCKVGHETLSTFLVSPKSPHYVQFLIFFLLLSSHLQLPKFLELVGLAYTAWFAYRYLLFKVLLENSYHVLIYYLQKQLACCHSSSIFPTISRKFMIYNKFQYFGR